MPDPQKEVRVWLCGAGDPVDVTNNHAVACASPFTIGIGLGEERTREISRKRPSLQFRVREGDRRLLAEIGLRRSVTVSGGCGELSLFDVRSCDNYCLARPRLWAYDLYQWFVRHRSDKNPEIPMSVLGARSMNACFICPRPVVLVSVRCGDKGNIFPMNLFGSIGEGYFAFALNSTRKAAPLVERAGRVALSSMPFDHADVVRELGKNHRKDSVDWDQLPFTTTLSPALGLPVPQFALRIRELQIEAVRKLGSHTLFFARLIRDERRKEDLQFCMIHGIYQAWRLRTGASQARPSIGRAKA